MKTGELVHHLRVLDCEQCYLCRECKGPHKLKCFLFGDAADMLDAQQKRIKELESEKDEGAGGMRGKPGGMQGVPGAWT